MENINIIDKNWKSLTKPKKLEIESSEDKSIATVKGEEKERYLHAGGPGDNLIIRDVFKNHQRRDA